jgi:hypothetical protein
MVILVHWRIWNEQNNRIISSTHFSVQEVTDAIREDMRMWRAASCIAIFQT